MQQLSARQLKAGMDLQPELPQLLDVREPWEVRLCALAGSLHIPMDQIPARLGELDPSRQTVVICHHGVRSHHVARFLEHQGFADVWNLSGGIDAWAREIDREMATY
ncbi:MAG: rhodanese-like domain-containing protein [Acidiferrobacterales bacterium]